MQEVKAAQTSPSGVRRPSTGIGRPMTISRRRFIQAATAVAAVAPRASSAQPAGQSGAYSSPPAVARLQPLPGQASDHRRRAPGAHREGAAADVRARHRRDRPRAAGRAWRTSSTCAGGERAAVPLVIPAKGELAYVAPGFEEARAREITKFSDDVRVWQEDEDPIHGRRGHPAGPRRGDRQGGPRGARPLLHRRRPAQGGARVEFVLATPVTAGCRMIKSAAEIALMQRANDITIAAYRAAFATLPRA